MAFFARIRKALFLTFIISTLTLTANAYDVKGGEVQVGSSVNMRASSSTSADVLSKLTNGERVAVLAEENGFYKVAYGGQSGFISSEYIELSDVMNVEPGSAKIITDVLNVRSAPSTSSDIVARLSKDTTVKIIGINSGWFKIEASTYTGYIHPDYVEVVANSIAGNTASSGNASNTESSVSSRQQIIDYAATLLGTPYVYGGSSPKGFDCSGFTQYVFAHFNISLPHSSSSQYKSSVTKISRSELQVGDLVFFSSGGSGVGHVGIYVGGGSFIHAPSAGKSVCYDSLDSSYYSSHYIGAGSIF